MAARSDSSCEYFLSLPTEAKIEDHNEAHHLERTGDPPGNNNPLKPKMQRRQMENSNRMAGRPGEKAAVQHSSPLRMLIKEHDREGTYMTANRHLTNDGDSLKPQGRLSPDVPDDEHCLIGQRKSTTTVTER